MVLQKSRQRYSEYWVALLIIFAALGGTVVLYSYLSQSSTNNLYDSREVHRAQLPVLQQFQEGPEGLLKRRIYELELELDTLKQQLLSEKLEKEKLLHLLDGCTEKDLIKADAYVNLQHKLEAINEYRKSRLALSELVQPVALHSEFEVIPFELFTSDKLFRIDPGAGKRTVELLIGFRRQELTETITHARSILTKAGNPPGVNYEFLEGVHRTLPSVGSVYELLFQVTTNQTFTTWQQIKLFRPFSKLELHSVGRLALGRAEEVRDVHVIVPFHQRIDMLERFIEHTTQTMLKDAHFHVRIVNFGAPKSTAAEPSWESQINDLIDRLVPINSRSRFSLLTVNDTSFSRAGALHEGAVSLLSAQDRGGDQGDVLMFFCDVDMLFNPEFLQRCRMHTEAGSSVYYPIVFSLYNPLFSSITADSNVDNLLAHLRLDGNVFNGSVFESPQPLVISRESGYWRDFGFGMSCQYLSDYLSLGRFAWNYTRADQRAKSKLIGSGRTAGDAAAWGLEDVTLYLHYLQSGKRRVVRASDSSIFHLYHPKHCDRARMTPKQLNGCVRSRVLSEGSQTQLGTALLNLLSKLQAESE